MDDFKYLKIDLKFASKVFWSQIQYQGCQLDCNILTIGGPIRLMYSIVLTFRSLWVLIWGCITVLLDYSEGYFAS